MGEAAPYTNAGGEASELYDAQLYLLLAGYDAAEKAEDAAAEWMEMASERYEIEGAFADASFNGQPFEIAAYTCASGSTAARAWGRPAVPAGPRRTSPPGGLFGGMPLCGLRGGAAMGLFIRDDPHYNENERQRGFDRYKPRRAPPSPRPGASRPSSSASRRASSTAARAWGRPAVPV